MLTRLWMERRVSDEKTGASDKGPPDPLVSLSVLFSESLAPFLRGHLVPHKTRMRPPGTLVLGVENDFED